MAKTKTDWKGNYWVSLPAGTYDVKFSRYGYETLTTSAVVVSAPSTTLNATLTPLPKLTGQVTDPGALPLGHVARPGRRHARARDARDPRLPLRRG